MKNAQVNPDDAFCFANRDEWRDWLFQNHTISNEIWIVYHKKKSRFKSITYNEAVEEALCFGWIDSTVRTIDEERYMQKFTPRKKKSVWANTNKERVKKMIDIGKMTEFGMAKVEEAKANGNWEKSYGSAAKNKDIPKDLMEALSSNKIAYTNFMNFAPSYQRTYVFWIQFSKKEETRKRRIQKVVEFAEQNIKPGML